MMPKVVFVFLNQGGNIDFLLFECGIDHADLTFPYVKFTLLGTLCEPGDLVIIAQASSVKPGAERMLFVGRGDRGG